MDTFIANLWQLLSQYGSQLLSAFLVNITMASVALLLALILGYGLARLRLSPQLPLKAAGFITIALLRPLMPGLLIPIVFLLAKPPTGSTAAVLLIILLMALWGSAYCAENYRSLIQPPPTSTTVHPPLRSGDISLLSMNLFLMLLQISGVSALVAVHELWGTLTRIMTLTLQPIETGLLVAGLYLLFTLCAQCTLWGILGWARRHPYRRNLPT